MATQTTNYNLVKPALTDSPPDITVMNPNWDKIDSELKINSSAIGQISNDRGYLNPKRITLAEMETTFLSGKYFIAGAMGYLDITSHDTAPSDYCLQTHYSLAGDLVRCRTRNAGTWTAWKEIPYTSISGFTLKNGWNGFVKAVKNGQCVSVIGVVYGGALSGIIAQTTDSSFFPGSQREHCCFRGNDGKAFGITMVGSDLNINNLMGTWDNSLKYIDFTYFT